MTCNKDCKNCIYGAQKPKLICGVRWQVTCNGNCSSCAYAQISSVEYICCFPRPANDSLLTSKF